MARKTLSLIRALLLVIGLVSTSIGDYKTLANHLMSEKTVSAKARARLTERRPMFSKPKERSLHNSLEIHQAQLEA